jgi:molybdenum cofactor cytidylyltransferase
MKISAIVLAAGASRRMGNPKMVLPWGNTTVIGHVTSVLMASGVGEIVVVTGGSQREVEAALKNQPVRLVFNSHFDTGEMLSSLQVGLSHMNDDVDTVMVVLGDQPQIKTEVIREIIHTYIETKAPLVIPSYQNRRGHPWLVSRPLWKNIFKLNPPDTLKDMIDEFTDYIVYVPVDTDTILRDLDTPDDYLREKKG